MRYCVYSSQTDRQTLRQNDLSHEERLIRSLYSLILSLARSNLAFVDPGAEPKHNETFYRYLSLLQHLLLAVCVTPLTSSFLNMLVVQDNLLAHNFAKILTVFEVVSLQTRQQISAEVTRLRSAFYVR